MRTMSAPLSHRRPAAVPFFLYGSCYYPEHWDGPTRTNDARWMKEAGWNVVRMAEFAWDLLEPEEGRYDFSLFDDVIKKLGDEGISSILGTPTAGPPRWLTLKYPEVLGVDSQGRALEHGSRQHASVSSPKYREFSRKITQAMADHFKANPHVIGWQLDNEFYCHFSEDHSLSAQNGFRAFLKKKYGNIDKLNHAWGVAFWTQTYRSFEDIITPKNQRPTWINPSAAVDYKRFLSDAVTAFAKEQADILRKANSKWFITHNGLMGNIDYRGEFTEQLDFLGYDVYPFFNNDPVTVSQGQVWGLDRCRSLSGNFIIPEQQSGPGGQGNYFHDRPELGEMRRMFYLSVARGADSLLFFRWRTCRFGAEEYWCGVIEHDNIRRRLYDEAKQIGTEIRTLGKEILGTSVFVDCAVAAGDYEVQEASNALSLGLPWVDQTAQECHQLLLDKGYAVGAVHPEDDLSGVKLYVLPHWPLFKKSWADKLKKYVEEGGTLVVGARCGTKDENNHVVAESLPGVLRELTDVTVVDYGRQNSPAKRPVKLKIGDEAVLTDLWWEQLERGKEAKIVATWGSRWLAGSAAITKRKLGKGTVYYVGTYLKPNVLEALLPALIRDSGLKPLWVGTPKGVLVTRREDKKKKLWFFINTTERPLRLPKLPKGEVLLKPKSGLGPLAPHEVVVIKE